MAPPRKKNEVIDRPLAQLSAIVKSLVERNFPQTQTSGENADLNQGTVVSNGLSCNLLHTPPRMTMAFNAPLVQMGTQKEADARDAQSAEDARKKLENEMRAVFEPQGGWPNEGQPTVVLRGGTSQYPAAVMFSGQPAELVERLKTNLTKPELAEVGQHLMQSQGVSRAKKSGN